MKRIESQKKLISKSDITIYSFLSDFTKFNKLMPDRVIDWQSTTDTCSFTIKGTASLGMIISERIPYNYIKIINARKSPINFIFHIYLKSSEIEKTEVQFVFDADLNPFLEMVATTPLTNLLNIMIDRLGEVET